MKGRFGNYYLDTSKQVMEDAWSEFNSIEDKNY